MLMGFVVFIPFSTYFSASKNPFMHPVLVFHNALDSGEGPLLGQGNSESTHSIKGLHRSTTSLQVGLDGTVHLISEMVPRERHLADDKQDS